MFSITITKKDFDFLRTSLFTNDNLENAAFAVCGYRKNGKDVELLVRKVVPVPQGSYSQRTAFHLEISPSFINRMIDESHDKFAILNIHSHPGGLNITYSKSDDIGESRLFKVYNELVPNAPHASLLFSTNGVIGRYWDKDRFHSIDRVRVVGAFLQTILFSKVKDEDLRSLSLYDRQILAFGSEFQKRLQRIKVGIVGLGGTGSVVAEQLVRLGVKDFHLVDPDTFESSNLSRMYGSKNSDLKHQEAKVRIIERHLKRINPSVRVTLTQESVVRQNTIVRLSECDVVFSCTDNDWSRSILNRFAYQYLIPLVNLGIRIVSKEGRIDGAAGRLSLVGPDMPCLWCLHHLDSDRIRAESMDPSERKKLEKEKYVEGIDIKAPSVISLNSTMSSLAVTMLLSMVSGFSKVPSLSSEQVYDAVEGIVFTTHGRSDPGCNICGVNGLKAVGDLQVVSTYE